MVSACCNMAMLVLLSFLSFYDKVIFHVDEMAPFEKYWHWTNKDYCRPRKWNAAIWLVLRGTPFPSVVPLADINATVSYMTSNWRHSNSENLYWRRIFLLDYNFFMPKFRFLFTEMDRQVFLWGRQNICSTSCRPTLEMLCSRRAMLDSVSPRPTLSA